MPDIRNLGDLLELTIENMPRGEFDETLQKRDVPLCRMVFGDRKVSKSGGFAMKDRIRVRPSTSGRFVVPYEGTGASNDNYMVSIVTDWATFIDKMPFNELEEDLNSGDATRIIDLVEGRRSAAYEGLYNMLETSLAREPQNASDSRALWGFPYWFRRRAKVGEVDTQGGFNGQTIRYGDGSTSTYLGYGSSADASLPQNANLRNWCATYTGTVNLTAFQTIRKAKRRTQFRALSELKGNLDRGGRQVLLMGEDQAEQYENLVNGSTADQAGYDDNNGDMTKHKRYLIDGLEMIPVPEFSTLDYYPIYGVKMGYIEGCILKSRWMREMKPVQDTDDPLTYNVPIVGTCNMKVLNPRNAGFVVSLGTAS